VNELLDCEGILAHGEIKVEFPVGGGGGATEFLGSN